MTAPSGLTETLHRKNKRRTWALRIAGAVPAVAAVAVGATLALSAGSMHSGTAGGSDVITVGFVTERTSAALGDLSAYVEHERSSHEGRDGKAASTIESWSDPKTSRDVQNVEVFFGDTRSYTVAIDGSNATELNHDKKKWWTYQVNTPTAVNSDQIQSLPPGLNPADLKRALDNGKLTLVGKESLDGKPAVHLQWLGGPDSAVDTKTEESMQIWVDAQSYLPVRVIDKTFTGTTTSNYEWLPRTPQNLAKLEVTPPAGYKKLSCVPTPAEDCGLND